MKEGKLTKRQLDRIKRVQSASSNSIEHFAFFLGCIVSFFVFFFKLLLLLLLRSFGWEGRRFF